MHDFSLFLTNTLISFVAIVLTSHNKSSVKVTHPCWRQSIRILLELKLLIVWVL